MLKRILTVLAAGAVVLGITAAPAMAADASCGTPPAACYYWETGSANTSATLPTGFYVAMDVYQPTLNTTTDYHTLAEIIVKNVAGSTIELGWRVTSAGGSPTLFSSWWANGVWAGGYNTGLGTLAQCGLSSFSLTPGSAITGTYPLLKKFGIEHTGTWPNGAWYLAYDTGWAGCILDSTLATAGASTFTNATYVAGYGEVASKLDAGLGAGHKPCSQMGSGTVATSTTGARIANAQNQSGTFIPLTLTSGASAGTTVSYYTIAGFGTTGASFRYGGKPTVATPPCS